MFLYKTFKCYRRQKWEWIIHSKHIYLNTLCRYFNTMYRHSILTMDNEWLRQVSRFQMICPVLCQYFGVRNLNNMAYILFFFQTPPSYHRTPILFFLIPTLSVNHGISLGYRIYISRCQINKYWSFYNIMFKYRINEYSHLIDRQC